MAKMFTPKYTITARLLENIKRINAIIFELNSRRFPGVVLVSLQKTAEIISSYSSTSIEGNPLPLTEVKKLLKNQPENLRDSEREVVNYNHILGELNKRLKKGTVKISLSLVLDIQKKVMDALLPKFKTGRLRDEPVFVNDPKTGKVIYLPPDHQEVKKLMEDLIDYVEKNNKTVDPLIVAGIFHKQFVLIHPFLDGNGRTARLATKIIMANMGLNTFSLFSFENYYNNNVTKYFQKVGEFGNYYEVKDNLDFTSWLEYFTDGIIDELLRVQKNLPSRAIGIYPQKMTQWQRLILDYLKKNGSITTAEYGKLSKRAKATRTLDFKKLLKLGWIKRVGKGRATYYLAVP